jgi:hypothetical protein
MSLLTMRIQNVYGDFLRSFKVFIDRITGHSLNKIEWNYGAKPLEYYYMMNGHESFEYPVAIVDIQDIQPVDGVSPIARNAFMKVNASAHQIPIAENTTKNQQLILDKRWVNLIFTVTINTEDVTSMLHYHDLFIGNLPLNYMFYDYIYYTYIDVTSITKGWDYMNDTIENVFLKYDPTFRYEPDMHYKETNEPFKESHERDRSAGRDDFPVMEGYRYYAMIEAEPIIKLTSVTKQTDKESSMHSLILNFEARIEIPNMLIWKQDYDVTSLEIVIDTVPKVNRPQKYPILIDMPDNFLTNKNISKGILIAPENFVFPDQEIPPDFGTEPYLEVYTYINTDIYSVALWAVENVTETSSSRFFIPLEHSTIEYVRNDEDDIVATRFTFKEMEWFKEFELTNPFIYLKVILFAKQASINP